MTTIDQKIAELLNNWTYDGWPIGNFIACVIAIALSVILCGAVGIEREFRGRSAGLRTHLLVGVGSCVLMIISIYGFPLIPGWNRDIARLAAQIITGVGFLGAGAIMNRTNGGIKGLTTAATIWIVMAIGIACGSFNFILAVLTTVVIIVVLTLFKKVEVILNKKNPTIILVAPANEPVLNKVLTVSKKYDCSVHGLSTELFDNGEKKEVQLTFQAVFNSGEDRVMEYVSELEIETDAKSVQLLGHR